MTDPHHHPHAQVRTGLSLTIAGVILEAFIDEATRTVRIVQRGEPLNGDGEAIAEARELLAGRVQRVRPDLTIVG